MQNEIFEPLCNPSHKFYVQKPKNRQTFFTDNNDRIELLENLLVCPSLSNSLRTKTELVK